MSPPPDDLGRRCRNAQLLGVQMILCVGIYGYVIETVRTVYAPFTGFYPVARVDLLRILLAVMAVATLVVIRIIVSKLLAEQARGVEILGHVRQPAGASRPILP